MRACIAVQFDFIIKTIKGEAQPIFGAPDLSVLSVINTTEIYKIYAEQTVAAGFLCQMFEEIQQCATEDPNRPGARDACTSSQDLQ